MPEKNPCQNAIKHRFSFCGSAVSLVTWPHGESWWRFWWEKGLFSLPLALFHDLWWYEKGQVATNPNVMIWIEWKHNFKHCFTWTLLMLCLWQHCSFWIVHFSPLFSGFSWNSLTVIKNICWHVGLMYSMPLLLHHCVVMPTPPTVWCQKRGFCHDNLLVLGVWWHGRVSVYVSVCVLQIRITYVILSIAAFFKNCGYNEK